MNSAADIQLEAITGLFLLPVPVAAQILGISVPTANKSLPVVKQGYRTKVVSVADIRAYIAARQAKKRIIKK